MHLFKEESGNQQNSPDYPAPQNGIEEYHIDCDSSIEKVIRQAYTRSEPTYYTFMLGSCCWQRRNGHSDYYTSKTDTSNPESGKVGSQFLS